ncbi:hypothetical protein BDW22DRAFT_201116 [Trametopsis cervina]|nr:hypothetical protein BDW22DRAFT_201116 [Trametopsis cervina]
MSPKYHSTRKSSDAENFGLKPKMHKKAVGRLASASNLRDSSLRRRTRVISGLTVPKYIMNNARRQKSQVKAAADLCFSYTLPTPPASPMSVSPASGESEAPSRRVSIQFPRRLVRPQTKTVRHESVAACSPEELKDVPLHYVRQALDVLGPQMMQVCSGIRAPAFSSTNGLPKELVVLANDLSAQMPTHLLAVYGKSEKTAAPSAGRTSMSLFPAHNIVLSAFCANMPSLPYQPPTPPAQAGGSIQLPVVPLGLPHPQSYAHIQRYLYTKDRVSFIMSLLPSVSAQGILSDPASASVRYAKDVAGTFTTQKILSLLRDVHGVYRNMVALEIQEDLMWQLVNVAWEVLLTALALSAKAPQLAPLL